jgi:hypothetical protein
MSEAAPPPAVSPDQAWVAIETELAADELVAFCRADVERLFRVNPMLEFLDWRRTDDRSYVMKVRNLSNGLVVETPLAVETTADGLKVLYDAGLKTSTTFRVEALGSRSRLVVTDDYGGTPEAERHARANEIDRSLVPWGHDLYRYLRHWRRWSGFRLWRWYMARVWQPMKPTARRITFILIAVTVFEIVAALLAVLIFGMGWETYFQRL